MIKNINKIVAVAIATVFLIPVVAFAEPSVSDAGSSGSAVSSSGPSTSDSGNAGVTSSPSGPSTSDQGNSAVSSTPGGVSTSDQGNSAVSNSGNGSTPSTSDQGNSGNTSSGGSSNNNGDSSGSRGGGRSRRSKTATAINALPVVNTSDCPYIASYMKFGGNNDVVQVTKLQTFLKNNEKLNVDVNGKFDQKTMDAVKLFQTKYANEILLPWGGSKATGHVFYTTQKKINELVCNKAIALTSVQLKAIQDFKDGRKNEIVKIETNKDSVIKSDSASTTSVVEIGVSSTTDDEQTASAVDASVGSKVWSFVKWLFGYKK